MIRFASLFFLTLLMAFIAVFPSRGADRLLVFAPSSLTGTVDRLADEFTAESGIDVRISIAGTSQLARQLEAGAPADVFISADKIWMDWLGERKLLAAGGSEMVIATNSLVIAVRRETENWVDVEGLITGGRFAMAEPEAVPAGRYAKQALVSRGWWEAGKTNASYGENVRVTLRRLVLGEVGAAIVYGSDLESEPGVRAAFTFAENEHSPILTFAAATANASKEAAKFLTFLSGAKARSILLDAGFKAPPE